MKNSVLAILILLTAVNVSFTQSFQNVFDLGSDDYANMSVVGTTADVYSVGSTDYTGAGEYDAFLIKSDTSGNFVWHKQYGGAQTEYGTAITSVNDGFAIAGRSNSFGSSTDILLIKTDINGDIQWAKTYGGTNEDYANYVATTMDGGFVVTGLTRSFGNGGQEVFILKTDATGNVVWFKTYGTNSDEFGYFVQQVADTGYVVSGVSRGVGGAGMNDAYVLKTDSLGNIEMQFLIGGSGDDEARRMLFPSSTQWIVAGKSRSNNQDDILMGQFNTQNFTFDWINTYGGNDNDGVGGIVQIPGEGYAVGGITQSFGSGQEGLILQVDTTGVVSLSATLNGGMDDFVQDLTLTNNGEIITGFTNSFGGVGNSIYLAKVSNAPLCYSSQVTLDVTSMAPSIAGPVLASFTENTVSVTASAVTLTQSTTTATVTDICSIAPALSADAGNDTSSCNGNAVVIGGNPTANGGTPPYTYIWSPTSGLDDSTAANPNATLGLYSVTVTDNSGATATDQVSVSADSLPNAVINPPGPNICEGQNVTLTASGGTSYSWSTGETTAVIVDVPTSATTSYSVTVTNNCGTATATEVVTSFTRPTVIVTPNNPIICDTSSTGVTLHATGAETYAWTPSFGLSSDTSSNPVAIPDTTTTYTVTGKNGHCAGNNPTTVTVTVDVCLGVEDIPQSIANIFPNPANDVLNINVFSNRFSKGILSVIAMDGKVILENKLNFNGGINSISLETSELNSGFYFIRIKTTDMISVGKVIIE